MSQSQININNNLGNKSYKFTQLISSFKGLLIHDYIHNKILIDSYFCEHLSLLTIDEADENNRSTGTEVAIKHEISRAIFDKRGYRCDFATTMMSVPSETLGASS